MLKLEHFCQQGLVKIPSSVCFISITAPLWSPVHVVPRSVELFAFKKNLLNIFFTFLGMPNCTYWILSICFKRRCWKTVHLLWLITLIVNEWETNAIWKRNLEDKLSVDVSMSMNEGFDSRDTMSNLEKIGWKVVPNCLQKSSKWVLASSIVPHLLCK